MTTTVYMNYDGQVFRPEEPVDLKPDTRVRATIETAEEAQGQYGVFLNTATSLNLEGPPDWSTRLEHYLYSAPQSA